MRPTAGLVAYLHTRQKAGEEGERAYGGAMKQGRRGSGHMEVL